eukprot:scaffold459448_cov17-Prasinocladus_malaysianus.AAC.1
MYGLPCRQVLGDKAESAHYASLAATLGTIYTRLLSLSSSEAQQLAIAECGLPVYLYLVL